MKLIDRYIFRELMGPFFLGLFVFTFVMLANVLVKLLELFISKGVALGTTISLLVMSLPFLLVMTIPMSVLLAVLVAFSRLSTDSEITAMRASGISYNRMLPPVIIFALLAYIMTSYIYIGLLPRSNLAVKQIRYDILRTQANVGIKPHVFNTDFIHFVIYVNNIVNPTGDLEGVFIADNRNPENPSVIVAESGHEITDPEHQTVILRLENGCTHEVFRNDEKLYSVTPYQTMDLILDMNLFKPEAVTKSDREMTIGELLRKARDRETAGKSSNRQWVEIYKKAALPSACLIFALLGVPLGIVSRRGGKSAAFASSIGLILVYYIFLTGGTGIAEEDKAPPFLATWLPNFVLSALAVFLYLRLIQETPLKLWSRMSDSLVISFDRFMKHFTRQKMKTHGMIRDRSGQKLFFSRILDRYILSVFIQTFIYVLSSLLAISLIVHAFEKVDVLIENQAGLPDAFVALILKVPFFGYIAIPFATLVATILTIGILSRHSEITAMRASGISYSRITLPMLVVGLLITILTFFLNESIIPLCNRKVESAWDRIKQRQRTQFVRYQRWYRGEKGDIYYFKHFDSEKKEISGFSQFTLDDDMKIRSRIETNRLFWDGRQWIADSGRTLSISEECRLDAFEPFSNATVAIPERPEDFSKEYKDSDEMNILELREYIEVLKRVGFDTMEYEVDWHAKISIPFLSSIMVLIGIAFSSIKPRATGGLVGIGTSIFLGAGYFIVFRISLELGQADRLPPILAAWIANILFLASSIYFAMKIDRE